MRFTVAIIVGVLVAAEACADDPASDLAIVGYLPSYRVETFRASQARQLTDVILFAVEPRRDGTIDASKITPEFVRKVDRQLEGTDVRKLLTIGGWGKSDAFGQALADPGRRTRLIGELARLCDRYQLGGIDVDWEHPASADEYRSLITFLNELHQKLASHERIVTTAVAPWKLPPASVFHFVDRIHLMAYDNGGRHSTFDLAFDAVDKLLQNGIPAQKICLGIPFYGRPYEGEFGEATTYVELQRQHETLKPSDNEVDGIFFNGSELVARKVRLARRLGLAGVMIWELGQDAPDVERSLLHTIHKTATTAGKPEL